MDKNFMTKKFGASGINREMFKDCFDCPIDMTNLSDSDMQKLADEVETHLRNCYPDADEMFKLWNKEEFTDDDAILIAANYREAWEDYWEILGSHAVSATCAVGENETAMC